MERLLQVKCVLWGLIVLIQIHGNKCCFEEERLGLLKLKAFLLSNMEELGDTEHLPIPLSSWVDDRNSECCGWERVTCHSTSRHVTGLALYTDYESYFLYSGLLNMSLFLPFRELMSLDLSKNNFRCCVKNEGLERLASLKRLEVLNLARNYELGNHILQPLSAITSLKNLNLSGMRQDGLFPPHELSSLRNLQVLDLRGNYYHGSLAKQGFTILSKLSKLEHLDLSFNNINDSDTLPSLGALLTLKFLSLAENSLKGLPSKQGFERLANLKRLEVLNLEFNFELGNNILQPLGALTSLKNLNLRETGLDGLFLSLCVELSSLRNLQLLDLSFNNFNGSLSIQELLSFKKLKVLDLSYNDFVGNIRPSIGALSTLKALSLAYNKFNGSLPIPGFCELRNLEELNLRYNSFEGSIPQCLKNFRSLKHLDLSSNQFTGNIPSSVISSLTSLEHIDFSHNQFEGMFSFNSFSNHSKLKVVLLNDIGRKLEVETEYSGWVPMFQLENLGLSSCNLSGGKGVITKILSSQNELRVVDLSHNNLKGRFPHWLLENNTRLEYLYLRNNSFTGQFCLPAKCNTTSLYAMDISDNHFGGKLEENRWEMMQSIEFLNLSKNAFEGHMPSSFCNMSRLLSMDLSLNKFIGKIPKELIAGCLKDIDILHLSSNRFEGQIFSLSFNMTGLEILRLDGNHFAGAMSNTISKMNHLEMLDVSHNSMSGEIPNSIRNMTSLLILVMSYNLFKGQLPCTQMELDESVFLDVSHNYLLGSLPSCPGYARHSHFQGNRFSGSIPFFNSTNLKTLDIRDNSLTGSIPNSIGALPNLRILLLRGNYFRGSIPLELCKLKKVCLMDLSSNSLSGSIPHCFGSIAFGNIGASNLNLRWEWGLNFDLPFSDEYQSNIEQEVVEFVTKSTSRSYKGDILNYMSGLDLSCNNFTGEIPIELGNLSSIHALNLSHNQLRGSIPESFSNLTQLESFDLSHNTLGGEIPPRLTNLYNLEVFNVAYNNLSGKMPDMKAQFGTFNKSSYEGNPLLCGPPLDNNCSIILESPNLPAADYDESEGKWYEVDPTAFWSSFGASFIVILLGFATIIYVNPYWRRRWFYFIEESLYSCYYFVFDVLN